VEYKNDQLHGLWTNYYPNGSIRYTVHYKYNKKDGEMIEFYKNNKIKSISTYINDELIDRKIWDIEGNSVEK